MGKFRDISIELLPLIDVENLFPCCILSFIQLIFFKLCMRVDIWKEFYGIADGLLLSNSYKVMALDLCSELSFD